MKTAFRFRLYPNHKQELRLLRMIETSRRLWNDALAHRKRRWEEERLSTSYSQQCWILTAEALGPAVGGTLLAGRTGYSQTPRQGLQGVLRAPGGISKVQEVLLVWLVHQSPGVQRFSEAGCDPEETL